MSFCTEYGAAVLRWSMETFNTDVSHLLGDNLSPERCNDIIRFLIDTEDPRCEYYYGHIVAVKPHWFGDFQKWATEKGLDFPKPETCFLSMTVLGRSPEPQEVAYRECPHAERPYCEHCSGHEDLCGKKILAEKRENS